MGPRPEGMLKYFTGIPCRYQTKLNSQLSLALICRRPTCDLVAVCNWQCSATCSMGCRCICDGSPAYSNWREMQIELAQFSTVSLVIWIESSCWSASFRLLSSLRWPTRAIQKYKFQYNNTIISIRVQQYVYQCEKNTFLYNNIYSSKDSIPVQNYKFRYRNICSSTEIYSRPRVGAQ